MQEITGQLIGGPDDGNLVTSAVSEIPIVTETRLWLDGIDKSPSTVVTKGFYIWKEQSGYFEWKLVTSEVLKPVFEGI